MSTFHHGGRIGDMVFALWTVKELGGGDLYVSDYHQGNWSLEMAESMRSFLLAQPYIRNVYIMPHRHLPAIDYDLQKAEDDRNPEWFPEWDHKEWPSNANILKRYAVHFGLVHRYESWLETREPWLTAPAGLDIDVAVHCPMRRAVRTRQDWIRIMHSIIEYDLRIVLIGGEEDLRGIGGTLLDSARIINSARLFLGTVSSCNAIAEGLGKTRLVEQAEGCFNVHVDPPSLCINGMTDNETVRAVLDRL